MKLIRLKLKDSQTEKLKLIEGIKIEGSAESTMSAVKFFYVL